MIQSIFVFLSEAASLFPALRSPRSDRATMRLHLRDNNRGHYTNTHVVLHANSTWDRCGERTCGQKRLLKAERAKLDLRFLRFRLERPRFFPARQPEKPLINIVHESAI
jgi:hypothetical protein